jgi:hypothetical protein
MLNRPFRSVAELGMVCRNSPWRTLDLFSTKSADSALLDLFCVGPTPTLDNQPPPKVVAGKVNLNSAPAEVLQSLITGTARMLSGVSALSATSPAPVPATDATGISTDIVNLIKTAPLQSIGDLVAIFPQDTTFNAKYPGNKIQREAMLRALADSGGTRTWNLLIDVIAQSGRYRPGATGLSDFIVEGEKRYWLHVAIDRFTGETVDTQLEPVFEQ